MRSDSKSDHFFPNFRIYQKHEARHVNRNTSGEAFVSSYNKKNLELSKGDCKQFVQGVGYNPEPVLA